MMKLHYIMAQRMPEYQKIIKSHNSRTIFKASPISDSIIKLLQRSVGQLRLLSFRRNAYRTLQNIIRTQNCELCQLSKLSTPFPAGGYQFDTASSTRSSLESAKMAAV